MVGRVARSQGLRDPLKLQLTQWLIHLNVMWTTLHSKSLGMKAPWILRAIGCRRARWRWIF